MNDHNSIPPPEPSGGHDSTQRRHHWRTRLIHSNTQAPGGFRGVAPVVYRGSTVLFDRLVHTSEDWRKDADYTYGLNGTPTTLELALRVAEIENAAHSFVVPSGQAAIALVYLAYCRAGGHALVPENAYGPNRELAGKSLAGLGIEVETYDPLLAGGIAELIRPTTTLIWCESPGSITMEVQDVPAIVAAAHAAASKSHSTTPTRPASCSTRSAMGSM